MPLRGDLLSPIPGPNPAGADLQYDPVYDEIKAARREDDDAPKGDWESPRKLADFALVAKSASQALATRSKDLQLAAWLTEAQLRREGFAGLREGLELLAQLLTQFWEGLYPPIEDGADLRARPLGWLALALTTSVRTVSLTRAGHDFFKYKESRAVGYEADASGDTKRLHAREQGIKEGKLAPEEFDKGFEATPKSWYKGLAADLDGSITALQALDRLGRERFGEDAPNFRRLQEALEEIQRVVRQLLGKKLEVEPDPPAPPAPPQSPDGARPGEVIGGRGAEPAAATDRQPIGWEAGDREDATARAVAAARFLRRTEPHNPAAYLLLRGFRWGELRASGASPDPRLLEAPSTAVRTHLKTLLLEARWGQLLEAAEGVMATPAGRGWLDLQRYAVSACDGLGGEYDGVARGIRGALRGLLADLPTLAEMTLMDDMPTANPETRRWLRDEGLNGAPGPGAGDGAGDGVEPASPAGPDGKARAGDRVLERAMTEARAGRPERGIEALTAELAREKSPRARFLRRTQIARLMVGSGLEAVAVPILRELLELIETHKLAEWETGETVAEPMALLYRCISRQTEAGSGGAASGLTTGDHTQASLYPRICSLDPLQAMALARP